MDTPTYSFNRRRAAKAAGRQQCHQRRHDGELDGLGEILIDGDSLGLVEGVTDFEPDGLLDGVPSLAEADGELDTLVLGVPSDGEAETDWDGDSEAELLADVDGEVDALVLGLVEAELDSLEDGDVEALALTDAETDADGVPSDAEADGDVDTDADTLVDGELDVDDDTLIDGVALCVSACVKPSTRTEIVPAPEVSRHRRVLSSSRIGSFEKSNGQNVAAAPPSGPIKDLISAPGLTPKFRPCPTSTVTAAQTAT